MPPMFFVLSADLAEKFPSQYVLRRSDDDRERFMSENMHSVLIAIGALRERYAINRGKVYELLRDGRLTGRKFGRRTLIELDSVRRFVASLPRVGGEPPRSAR